MLRHSDWRARRAAAEALGAAGKAARRAAPALASLHCDHYRVRQAAACALRLIRAK